MKTKIIEILRNNSYDCFILKDDKLDEIAEEIHALYELPKEEEIKSIIWNAGDIGSIKAITNLLKSER